MTDLQAVELIFGAILAISTIGVLVFRYAPVKVAIALMELCEELTRK